MNEVGQHSVDIYLKSCRYDAKKEDMRIGMKENKAKEEELWDDLVFPIQKMEENLKHCIFVFGNRILADSDVLGKPFEDKKKGKNRNKNESIDEEDEDGTQQVVKVDLLTTGGNIALDTRSCNQ